MPHRWKPNVTVAALIEREGRFLLVEEETTDGLKLNNPAGHLDPGESPVDGCAREALEEALLEYTGAVLVVSHDRYLLEDFAADIATGHRIVATVFVDCMAFYRADGPPALRPVGETEFANGVAAMCASGVYGELRACAGIVSHADLTLGADARAVLQAHIATAGGPGGRFKGIRHAGGWDASPLIHNSHTRPPPGLYGDATFRQGFAQLAPLGLRLLAQVIDQAKTSGNLPSMPQDEQFATNAPRLDVEKPHAAPKSAAS